ncbi:MAG: PEP-CTERM sorting domain-containing protein [Fimbriimonadaceae bacterium]
MKSFTAVLAVLGLSAAAHSAQILFATGTFTVDNGKIASQPMQFATYDLGVLNPALTGQSWAGIFGDQGQFFFVFDLGNVTAYDSDAPNSYGTPVSGTFDWAINNIQGNQVMDSLFRGTASGLTVPGDTSLLTDGGIHWYYGTNVTALSSWGLQDTITLKLNLPNQVGSGTTVQYNGAFYFNTVENGVPVPEPATIALAALGLAAAARRRKRA